jgi:D-alanyl-D-alanine carboxypeptidase/D-alanyl-D-alanine-endopeptidase (penicillin-binding protein 4)
LSELIRVVNKPSHNFFADQILRTLAVHEGFPAISMAAQAVRKWFEAIGAPDPDKLQMCDGSGLARQDYVQPRQFCALLRRIYNNPELRDVFRTSLPYVGEESTLDKRMVGTAAEGKVQAKTGYIGYVRGFSGYVTDASGRDLVFSMLVNNHNAGIDGADEVIDRACVTLASFRE